jgi:hypothetical protein
MYSCFMANAQFTIRRGAEILGNFYSSESGDLSNDEKRAICRILKHSLKGDMFFEVTSYAASDAFLPPSPDITSEDGRKFLGLSSRNDSSSLSWRLKAEAKSGCTVAPFAKSCGISAVIRTSPSRNQRRERSHKKMIRVPCEREAEVSHGNPNRFNLNQ